MKRKNNKGFTLIELLAVIVILGIILTIVVSSVVRYIAKARAGSYVDAYQIIIKDLKTQLMANEMSNGTASLAECDDSGLILCSTHTDYKGLYSSKNMMLRIEKNVSSGNYVITVTPTSNGSFSSVDISSQTINNAGKSGKTVSSTMDTSGTVTATNDVDIKEITTTKAS